MLCRHVSSLYNTFSSVTRCLVNPAGVSNTRKDGDRLHLPLQPRLASLGKDVHCIHENTKKIMVRQNKQLLCGKSLFGLYPKSSKKYEIKILEGGKKET